MFTMQYKHPADGTVRNMSAHYPTDIIAFMKQENLTPECVQQITGPGHREMDFEKLQLLAEDKIVIPGEFVKTPRFMAVRIAKIFGSEKEAIESGFTQDSGYQSKYYSILGKEVPNSRPIFAAAMC